MLVTSLHIYMCVCTFLFSCVGFPFSLYTFQFKYSTCQFLASVAAFWFSNCSSIHFYFGIACVTFLIPSAHVLLGLPSLRSSSAPSTATLRILYFFTFSWHGHHISSLFWMTGYSETRNNFIIPFFVTIFPISFFIAFPLLFSAYHWLNFFLSSQLSVSLCNVIVQFQISSIPTYTYLVLAVFVVKPLFSYSSLIFLPIYCMSSFWVMRTNCSVCKTLLCNLSPTCSHEFFHNSRASSISVMNSIAEMQQPCLRALCNYKSFRNVVAHLLFCCLFSIPAALQSFFHILNNKVKTLLIKNSTNFTWIIVCSLW